MCLRMIQPIGGTLVAPRYSHYRRSNRQHSHTAVRACGSQVFSSTQLEEVKRSWGRNYGTFAAESLTNDC